MKKYLISFTTTIGVIVAILGTLILLNNYPILAAIIVAIGIFAMLWFLVHIVLNGHEQ